MHNGSPFSAKESLVALWRKRPNLTIRFIHHLPKYLSTKWKQSYIILIIRISKSSMTNTTIQSTLLLSGSQQFGIRSQSFISYTIYYISPLVHLQVQSCLGVALDENACAVRPPASLQSSSNSSSRRTEEPCSAFERNGSFETGRKKATPRCTSKLLPKDFFWQSTTRF